LNYRRNRQKVNKKENYGMNELKDTKLARPLDRNAMNNDVATLRNLVGMLNNTEITGAVVPPDEENKFPPAQPMTPEVKEALEQVAREKRDIKSREMSQGGMLREEAVAAKRAAARAEAEVLRATLETTHEPQLAFSLPPGPKRIFFTGAPKAGKSWLAAQMGARAFELDDPIRAMARDSFGDVREEDYVEFANEVFAWGEGIVNSKRPLTAARAAFVSSFRQTGDSSIPFQEFGLAGFWAKALLARVARFQEEFPNELVVVTDIGTVDQYKALREQGFIAIHVTCNNITRSGRGGTGFMPSLVTSIERDITQKISQQPRGAKLWCVWCDDKYPLPSGRMLTTAEFLGGAR
jgi:hypothetical protein